MIGVFLLAQVVFRRELAHATLIAIPGLADANPDGSVVQASRGAYAALFADHLFRTPSLSGQADLNSLSLPAFFCVQRPLNRALRTLFHLKPCKDDRGSYRGGRSLRHEITKTKDRPCSTRS